MSGENEPTTERFEDVDWDAIDGASRGPTATSLAALAVGTAYALALAFDVVLAGDDPTIDVALDIPGSVQRAAFVWDVSAVEWLFLATLLVGGFALLPVARNRRLRAYYWRRFRRHTPAVVSFWYLLGIFLLGTLGTLVIEAPTLDVAAAYQPPVFASVDASVPVECVGRVADGRCHGTWQYPLGTTADGTPRLCVADNGPGVPDRERELLTGAGETQLEHGLGVGLWFVNWAVNQLGAELEFEQANAEGTVVVVRFYDAKGLTDEESDQSGDTTDRN